MTYIGDAPGNQLGWITQWSFLGFLDWPG